MNEQIYDIAIIGSGPAGYTSAIYSGRAGYSSVIFEKFSPGGQMGITSSIENYPGFLSVDGFTLDQAMSKQAKSFGAVIKSEEIVEAELEGKVKILKTKRNEYKARAVIIATGAKPRKLGLPKEEALAGKGVSYCATCDGMFYKDKDVIVAGGGDTALEDALYLSNICSKVTVVHRRDQFRAARHSVAKAEAKENIEFKLCANVTEILGDKKVEGVKLTYTDGREESIEAAGLFVAVGRIPDSALFRGKLDLDESGYIKAGEDCRTSVEGVFAAGDVRTKRLRQIVTACSDGACAVQAAEEWLG